MVGVVMASVSPLAAVTQFRRRAAQVLNGPFDLGQPFRCLNRAIADLAHGVADFFRAQFNPALLLFNYLQHL